MVSLRVIARGLSQDSRIPDRLEIASTPQRVVQSQRRVYFGPNHGWIDTAVVDRTVLDGNGRAGPLIIEEYDSTTVVPPSWQASVDQWQNIILDR
jgi:N-methylhydantoinase A